MRREFSVCSANSLSSTQIYHELTVFYENLLHEFTWYFADSLSNYLFCEFKINSISFSRINYLFRDSKINSLSVSRIRYLFREKNNESTIFSTIPLWVNCLFREFTILLGIYYEFTWSFAIHYGFLWSYYEFTIFLTNLLWIHWFSEFTMISVCVSHTYFEFTIY